MKYWFTDSNADLRALEGAPNLADKIKIVKDKMQVDAGVLDAVDVVSIPDVWNIHRIYEMMLLYGINDDDQVSLDYKQAVLKHWYAILAIHFLGAKKFELKFDTSSITQATIKAMPEEANTPEATAILLRTKLILQAAWDARPVTKISNSPNFDPDTIQVHYVVNDKGEKLPYAMSSATTYLVPTADAWKNLYSVCKDISWNQPNPDGIGFQIQDPVDVAGALTLVERETLVQRLNEIRNTDLTDTLSRDLGATQKVSKLFKDYASHMQKPIEEEDIYLGGLAIDMYYVEFTGCDAAANESDPNIGGMDNCCICSKQEANGKFTNYLVSVPITNQAKGWILEGRAEYSVTLPDFAGSPQFLCHYTIKDSSKSFPKVFSQVAANLHKIDQASMGVTALWPRYKMDDWGYYYVFHQPALGALVGGGETYSIEPEGTAEIERAFPTDTVSIRYKRLTKWPQAWTLFKIDANKHRSEIGFFLTRTIEVATQVAGQTYNAAIDFGTSSTMLYGGISKVGEACKVDEENIAEPIQGDHIWSLPIFAPKSGDGAAAVFSYFVPSTNSDTKFTPLQSILAIGKAKGTEILTGNWTYFQQAAEGKSRKTLPNNFEIHSNLKWDPINTLYTTSFLQLVSYYVALESRACGCSQLLAVISYPSAMTNWENYAKNMDKQLNIARKIAHLSEAEQPSVTITESRAVAQRTRKDAAKSTQFCSIDIGGGTSDIFIFKNDGNPKELTWDGYESSLMCGARSILLENFVTERCCLNALIGLVPGDPIMMALQANVPQMENWSTIKERETILRNIELLLSVNFKDDAGHEHNAGEELRQRAVSKQGLLDNSIAKLRKRVAYYSAAVLFYAGLMTRGTSTKVDQLQLRFAGNGSKTLDWISGNSNQNKRFLSEMFNAGAGVEEQGMRQNPNNIHFATSPKHEVADGALKRPMKMKIHVEEILAGEVVKVYDAVHEKPISEWPVGKNIASEQFKNTQYYVPDNRVLKTFIQAFRDATIGILQINLRADEFDLATPDEEGVKMTINEKVADIVAGHNPDKKSFFMIGVDALSDQYFR